MERILYYLGSKNRKLIMKYLSNQDKFLNENYFKNKRTGVFADIGAHNGNWCNKTLFFEKELGWNGVCIEPSPDNYIELIQNRNCRCINCALSDKEEYVDFYISSNTVLCGIVSNYTRRTWDIVNSFKTDNDDLIRIKTFTFNRVMAAVNMYEFDFINIDVEGSEIKILNSIDFDLFKIDFIIIEDHYDSDIVHDFLSGKNFKVIHREEYDYIYKNENYNGPYNV